MSRELPEAIINYCDKSEIISALSVEAINHKPHPYCITPKHVGYASDHHSGMLGDTAIEALEKNEGRGCCGMYTDGRGKWSSNRTAIFNLRCTALYHEHTSCTSLFIQLKRDATKQEVHEALLGLNPIVEAEKIEGYTFVETKQKFRVL